MNAHVRRSVPRRGLVAASATALVLTSGLLAAAPAHAEASVVAYAPACPPARLLKGVDLPPAPAMSPYDRDGGVEISAGALPAGIRLLGDLATHTPYAFAGSATALGTSTFTVTARFEDASAKSIDCTVTVVAAPVVGRVKGTDRFDQAVQVSKASFATAKTVYLASGEKFSDALSAGSVAGLHGAPLLLTPAAVLTAGTLAELKRLEPDHIVIVGGPASVSDDVADDLVAKIPDAAVTRIGGADRFEVSRALVQNPDFGVPSSPWVYLASGANFPDALAASPAAVAVNGPVVLVNGAETAPTAAETALFDDLSVNNVRIAGGPASVSAALQTSLEATYTVTRASGADRFEAAAAINREAFAASTTVYLASGLVFPDALSAAPVAGKDGHPIYLVQNDCVPAPVLTELQRLTPGKVVILGGLNTIGTAVELLKSC